MIISSSERVAAKGRQLELDGISLGCCVWHSSVIRCRRYTAFLDNSWRDFTGLFFSSLLHFFFYSHSFFSYSKLDGSRQVYNCTHRALYSSSSVCVSSSSLFFFLSLSIYSFVHSFLLCLSVTCGVIYNSCVRPSIQHTWRTIAFAELSFLSFGFPRRKWNSNNNSPIIRICTTRLLSRYPMPLCRLLLLAMSKAATEQHSSHSIIIWFQSSWPFFLVVVAVVVLLLCGAWSVQSV